MCFEVAENLERVYLSNGLLTNNQESLGVNVTELKLSSDLFTKEKDAIIFQGLNSTSVELLLNGDPDYRIDMQFHGFPFFGIWTKPDCNRFICLEPWAGIADPEHSDTTDFPQKKGILSLTPGALGTHRYEISFFAPSSVH